VDGGGERSVAPNSPHLSFVGLLPHFAFLNDVDIPFEKYLLNLIGFYLEMDGEYLLPTCFDGYR
jgi:hypothetical protein